MDVAEVVKRSGVPASGSGTTMTGARLFRGLPARKTVLPATRRAVPYAARG